MINTVTIISLILMTLFFMWALFTELREQHRNLAYICVAAIFILIPLNAAYQLS